MTKLTCLLLLVIIVGGILFWGWYVMRGAPGERTYSFTNITPGSERLPCMGLLVLALVGVSIYILKNADDIDKGSKM